MIISAILQQRPQLAISDHEGQYQFEALPQHESEKADQDMSLDAFGVLVPDGAHVQ